MANKQLDSSEKPSLEELLRVKQAEKPTEAFWGQFDRELHQRMMQALVKKDPWPVQLMRALTGRIAQAGAVAAALVFLSVMTMRPAFVSVEPVEAVPVLAMEVPSPVEAIAVETQEAVESVQQFFASSDYRIDTVLAADVISSAGVTREFEMDSVRSSSYDMAVYTPDSAFGSSSALASASVALVF